MTKKSMWANFIRKSLTLFQIWKAPSADGSTSGWILRVIRVLCVCLWVSMGQSEVFRYEDKYHNISITPGSVSKMIKRSYLINDADRANIARSTVHKIMSTGSTEWQQTRNTRHQPLINTYRHAIYDGMSYRSESTDERLHRPTYNFIGI